MRLGTGILVFLAVCLPWYYEMFTFWRVDDESKIFWFRFIIHDHFARLGSGVHTTTPGGTFTYFLEQGAFAIAPWVLLIPLSMSSLSPRGGEGRGEGRSRTRHRHPPRRESRWSRRKRSSAERRRCTRS
jgi:4-amino-4-deoxy-L-arabinose transferase-like glycosyltransferase